MSLAATPVPLSEAEARPSELARQVRQQHERIILTRNGQPEAVLLSVDDLEGLEMTLEILGDVEAATLPWAFGKAGGLPSEFPRGAAPGPAPAAPRQLPPPSSRQARHRGKEPSSPSVPILKPGKITGKGAARHV